MKLNRKNVLLTGGTGFVGANLARRLLYEGHTLHLVVRHNHTTWRIADIRDDITLHTVDMTDGSILDALIALIRPDWVFHLATYGASSWQTDSVQIAHTNFMATINLVNACLKTGFESFVNTGSSSEYGFKDFAPDEDSLLEPNSDYAVTKAAATLYCRSVAQRHNLLMPTLRLYSVYGPYEEPKRLVPTLIIRGLKGEFPPLVNPAIARDYVYIDDVIDAYLKATNTVTPNKGAIYNVGSGIQTSIRDTVEIVRQLLHIKAEPLYGSMPERQWDTTVWVANNARIKADLGWEPRQNLTDGVSATIAWLRGHPEIERFYESVILS